MAELKSIKEYNLYYRRFDCKNPKAVIILLYGLGASFIRWKFLIEFLNRNGFSAYAMELRGYGESKEKIRGHISSYKLYYQDVLHLLELIQKENPGKKVFLLGDSMGGLISFITTALCPDRFDGLILTCPYFKTGLKISFPLYLSLFSSLLYNWRKQLKLPFNAFMITRDTEFAKTVESDPRESRLATSGLLFRTLFQQLRAKQLAKSIKIPVLFMLSGKDLLADAKESKAMFKRLTTPDKTLIEYPELFHCLPIDVGKEKVFEDLLSWLKKRT